MTFKKIGSLLLGALMVVGLSSAVSAQTILQDGDGVRLRVTNPDNGGFVGIGKEVEVEVHYLTSINPTVIAVAIVTDTTGIAPDHFGSTSLVVPGATPAVAFAGEDADEFYQRIIPDADAVDDDDMDVLDITDAVPVKGEASFKKIVFKFRVVATSNASVSKATLAVAAYVDNADEGNGSVFNNLRTDELTISDDTGGGNFGFEGDGVQFAIDSNRPTGVITNVFIDANIDINKDDGAGIKKSQIFNPGWATGFVAPHDTVHTFEDLAGLIKDAELETPVLTPPAINGRLESAPGVSIFSDITPLPPVTAINIGDDLTVNFEVQGLPSGATGVVYIVDPDDIDTAADSSIFTFTFDFVDLQAIGGIRDSIKVDSGLIDTLTKASDFKFIGNNRRITAAAFLMDRAGNLSAVDRDGIDGEDQLMPIPTRDPNIHVLDLTPVTISPVRPKMVAAKAKAAGELPDSSRFTALTETAISIVDQTNGTASPNVDFDLNPFELSVDEGLTDIQVTFVTGDDEISLSFTGADNADGLDNAVIQDGENLDPADIAATDILLADGKTAGRDGVPDGVVAFDLTNLIIDPDADPDPGKTGLKRKTNKQGGHRGSWTVTVVDSAGNVTNDTQKDIWFDGVAPDTMDANYFPTEVGAPKDQTDAPTINSASSAVVLFLSEALDSLGVQYVENTAISPTTSIIRVSPGDVNLAMTDSPVKLTLSDSLITGEEYKLQVFQRDLSGNVSMTAIQSLLYDNEFENPEASEFKIVQDNKDVVAGQVMTITVTALDSAMTADTGSDVVAVTHSTEAFIRIEEVASAKKAAHITYTFDGDGVTDNEDGTATFDKYGWNLGVRDVDIVSTGIIEAFIVIVEDKTGDDVDFGAQTADTLSVEAADFRAFAVKVLEDGVETDDVSGEFTLWVHPTDIHGNPSAKVMHAADGMNPEEADSLNLLADEIDSTKHVLAEIFVEFSANAGDARPPIGPQVLPEGGASFPAFAPDRAGEGLVITVRSVNAGTLGFTNDVNEKFKLATGSSGPLTFTPFGEVPPRPPTDLEAPATLIVQDYYGADGEGDQGGFVMVSYTASEGATRHRLYRKIKVLAGPDENGDLVAFDTAVDTWVPWASFDAAADDDGIGRSVVPTLDNVATDYAIAAERGGVSSGQTPLGKRVFTKQLVQNMVSFLGVDPNRVLSTEELGQVFAPSEDYVKSIIGDQKDVQFTALDIDFTALVGGVSTVPQSIRTQTSPIQSSARTETDAPVKAVDNLPPAAVEGAAGSLDGANVSLEWQVSSDDRVVGSMSYLGYSIPIAGVDRYEVWRGESADAMELYATVDPGETTFLDQEVPGVSSVIYRIDAADLDNVTPGTAVTVDLITLRIPYETADGLPVYIILVNGASPLTQDFEDFIAFAGAFQKSAGEPGFLLQADTDDSGTIDFADFLAFAGAFQREAVVPAGAKIVPAALLPGVNDNVELTLSLSDSKVLAGHTVTVNVALANATALGGFGFEMLYDADKFEYVESAASEQDLLKSGGAETPLFLAHPVEAGQLVIANAVIDGAPVSGNGEVVSLTFKVLQEFEENARFEIADGIVFDHEQLPNPVVALGSLSVESTPTEFALLQNFPNPFNPETTIKYNLAEGTNVSLRIYNVVGQVVRTLVAEPQSAGRYTVRWNGSDDRGVSVSSGIYFYELRSNGFQDVKKLMLLK